MKLRLSIAGALSGGAVLSACLLADPGPTLPQPQNLPPFIESLNVQPQPEQVVTIVPSAPLTFTVPIVQVDPTKTYTWRVWVDYDPNASSDFENTGTGTGAEQAASFQIDSAVFSGEGCHTIQFIVAYAFESDNHDPSGHTPVSPPGGSGVSWFYSPGGDLAGCPEYSSEVDASFPDSGTDAGEAGTE